MLCVFQFGTYHFYPPGGGGGGGGSLVGEEGLLISGGWGLIFVQVVKWGSAKLCPNVRGVCYLKKKKKKKKKKKHCP